MIYVRVVRIAYFSPNLFVIATNDVDFNIVCCNHSHPAISKETPIQHYFCRFGFSFYLRTKPS